MKQFPKFLFFGIVFTLTFNPVRADKGYTQDDQGTMLPMGKHMLWFEDTDQTLDPSHALNADFKRFEVDAPNLGVTESAVWLKLNIAYSTEHRVIHIPNTELSKVEAYFFSKGRIVDQDIQGQLVPVNDRSQRHILLDLPGRTNIDNVLLKVTSETPLLLPVYLGTQEAYDAKRNNQNLIVGAYLGMMFFLLFYNIFVFLSTRYRSYRNYVIYIALVTLTQVHFMGLAKLYFWPSNTWIAGAASMILTVLTAIAANEFFKRFTNAWDTIPKMIKVSHVFCGLMLLELVLSLTLLPKLGYQLMQATVGSFAVYQLSMGIVLVVKKNRQAVFFLLAWFVFLIGIVVFILKDLTILPFNIATEHTMVFGSAIEGLLLSFGLADHIKILRREKQRSQEEALQAAKENERIIREQNVILEEKVSERTADLKKSNDELKSTQSQLVEAEKMASLGQLTAGIAHEINNPLNFISTNIPPLKRDLSEIIEVFNSQSEYLSTLEEDRAIEIRNRAKELDIDYTLSEVHDIVDSIAEGASRTTEIVRGLRDFSRHDEDGMKSADVNRGLKGTIVLLARTKARY